MKPLRFFAALFIGLCSLCGCKEAVEQPPMPEEKMQHILMDMHLAETYSQGLGDSVLNRFDKNYDSLAGFYTSILKHYNTSFETFNKTLDWYRDRPARMDTLYGKVLNQLMELKAKKGLNDVEENKPGAGSVTVPDTARAVTDTAHKPVFMKRDTSGK